MAFEIEETIQSQYAASPHINSLITGFYDLINPYPDIATFYDNVFNPSTAVGWGLNVWGRIVGVSRKVSGVPSSDDYFGFQNDYNAQAHPFAQAPFYADAWSDSVYDVEDAPYRLMIWAKAMANIGTGSLASINQQLAYLFSSDDRDIDVGVVNCGTMKVRIYIQGDLEGYERVLLSRGELPPIPAGVGFGLLNIDKHTFGFNGSGLEPFNQGVFCLYGGIVYGD